MLVYKTELLIWLKLLFPNFIPSPEHVWKPPRNKISRQSAFSKKARLSTLDGMTSHEATPEDNCCKKMLSSPKFCVTIKALLFHSFHSRQIVKFKTTNGGKKHFKRQTLISFKSLPVAVSSVSVLSSPVRLLGS